MTRTMNPVVRSVVLSCGVALIAASLSGCVGYNVYPPMEGERGFTNVNSDPFPPVITESLRWVVLRYPPNSSAEWNQPAAGNVGVTPFAVNLPQGMNRELAERIVKNLGDGAEPMLAGNEKLPIYHVSRVSVSGDDAKVDIIRPVVDVAYTGQGKEVTQAITLRLRGGMQPWHVTSHREWSFNSLQPPALSYLQGESPNTTASGEGADQSPDQSGGR